MKDDCLYLHHILECIQRIEDYTQEGAESFLADPKTQDAVLRNLQVLLESVQRLPAAWKSSYPREIPWHAIGGFRNRLARDYLGISLPRVWQVVASDLSSLKTVIQTMLDNSH
ncbi:MAG: DUF86 domain-containing protein [Vampirovibrionales bacterium]|nr:DUF86 domain-containing protein [Vampirovibrionales bacterium]